jgi:hypothetical protein
LVPIGLDTLAEAFAFGDLFAIDIKLGLDTAFGPAVDYETRIDNRRFLRRIYLDINLLGVLVRISVVIFVYKVLEADRADPSLKMISLLRLLEVSAAVTIACYLYRRSVFPVLRKRYQ